MRIAGINLPENKRLEIALTAVYGIGRSRARKILDAAKVEYGIKTPDLSADAEAAIAKWNGQELDGRKLTVNEARPMEPRAPRTGGFDRGNDRGGRTW